MKRAAMLTLSLLLCGCAYYGDLSADAFAHGKASQEQFTVDSRACQDQAERERSSSIRGIYADETERHTLYSTTLEACMKARGYERRTAWYNFWEGYDL